MPRNFRKGVANRLLVVVDIVVDFVVVL